MVELRWLALATAVLVCATATAASEALRPTADQHSAVALPGRDSDGDGLDDGAEVGRYQTNPRLADTDRDGLTTAPKSAATTPIRAGATPTATA